MRRVLSLLLLSSLSLPLFGQEGGQAAASKPSVPTLRALSEEVLLDVVVRDKHGRAVRDLDPDEVQVFEDGVRQKLTNFRLIRGDEVLSPKPAGTNGPAPAVAVPVDTQRQIHLVTLVFERLGEDGRRFARAAALRLLSDELRPNVYMAIFAIDNRLSVLQPFTSDHSKLREAIELATSGSYTQFPNVSAQIEHQIEVVQQANLAEEQVAQNLANGKSTPGQAAAANIEAQTQRIILRILKNAEASSRLQAGRASIFSLLSLFSGQQALPGRKTLVYFSEGLQVPSDLVEQFDSAISAANRANVSVYAVDARGLVIASQQDMGNRMLAQATQSSRTNQQTNRISENEIKTFDTARDSITANVQGTLAKLAESTGGILISDTNDLRAPMQRLAEDIETYYEMSYVPRNLEYDGKFRKITVKVSRPNVNVQSRSGYFALPPTEGSPLMPYEMPMLSALSARPLPHGFDYHAAAFHFGTEPAGVKYSIIVEVPLKGMAFTEDKAKGDYEGHLSVMALLKNEKGEVVQKLSQDQPLFVPVTKLGAVQEGNYVMRRHLVLSPGRYSLETAALDRNTMKASARRTALIVPPPASGVGISSLSVIRRIQPPAAGDNDPEDPLRVENGLIVPSLGDAIARGTGSGVSLYFVVYPSSELKDKAQLMLQYYREGQMVAQATPELPAADAQGRIHYIATAQADSFQPGQYEVKAVVRQGNTATEGSTVFTIAPGPNDK